MNDNFGIDSVKRYDNLEIVCVDSAFDGINIFKRNSNNIPDYLRENI